MVGVRLSKKERQKEGASRESLGRGFISSVGRSVFVLSCRNGVETDSRESHQLDSSKDQISMNFRTYLFPILYITVRQVSGFAHDW